MRNLIFLLLFLASCRGKEEPVVHISLAGEWRFRIDSLDTGIAEKWYSNSFDESVVLPGSMAENGKGYDIDLNTPWTGDIIDKSYFTSPRYEKYRQPGNIKLPFWLKPVKYYSGPAWYSKEVEIPAEWSGKKVILSLERPHWETRVYVNGAYAGSQNSLAVPHQFDVTGFLQAGKNAISIRVDNRVIIPVGLNSHSISDHTQTNWNGIAGDISLRAVSKVNITDIVVYPDLQRKNVKVLARISNSSREMFEGKVIIRAESFNTERPGKLKPVSAEVVTEADDLQLTLEYPMGNDFNTWSEFDPSLYRLTAVLKNKRGDIVDDKAEVFGMREFKVNGSRFAINGRDIFLRGTTECCIFPETGYPPSDTASWGKVIRTCKAYGLNHVRFHSYCPPKAAFEVADREGIYFHVECSSWANQNTSIGNGDIIDQFIYDEGDRIIREYGNHPSFCMLAYGNEPAGKNQNAYLGNLVEYWRARDKRRVYTSAAGWPLIPENDYHLTPAPRIQQWGDGLKSIINAAPPSTRYDFRDVVSRYNIPVIGHEIGQWCVYPDFSEISRYTGPLKATNFEIFRETLNENNMGDMAGQFLQASGKLQILCYKADIEAALRTPGYAGFQMLQLHDFPGQGTALVGILNPFFETKGYVKPEEFRMFCNTTVPLARIDRMILRSGEQFMADVELSHFGPAPLVNTAINCSITDQSGEILHKETFAGRDFGIGNCLPVGRVLYQTERTGIARKLTLNISVAVTEFKNAWDFWVYPSSDINPGSVVIKEKLDREAENILNNGGSVLLLPYSNISKGQGAEVAIGFSSIFWNTAWTNNQPPHTLGILVDPENPVFKGFPTEFHSNWQWWDPVMHSKVMIVDALPADMKPLIQPIDTWFENRRLALAFETKTGGGKLFVCSIDLSKLSEERIVSETLLKSILNYMNSQDFNPVHELTADELKKITGS